MTIDVSIPRIPMTSRSSISVKPFKFCFVVASTVLSIEEGIGERNVRRERLGIIFCHKKTSSNYGGGFWYAKN
jgi:hypothetical protein